MKGKKSDCRHSACRNFVITLTGVKTQIPRKERKKPVITRRDELSAVQYLNGGVPTNMGCKSLAIRKPRGKNEMASEMKVSRISRKGKKELLEMERVSVSWGCFHGKGTP